MHLHITLLYSSKHRFNIFKAGRPLSIWELRTEEAYIDLELTRAPNQRYWVESARRSSPGRRALYNWVQTACTDWVKKRTLEFKRLHLNLNKQCLINDQKQEPRRTTRNPPPISQLVLPVKLPNVHKHTENQILLFKSIHQPFLLCWHFSFLASLKDFKYLV